MGTQSEHVLRDIEAVLDAAGLVIGRAPNSGLNRIQQEARDYPIRAGSYSTTSGFTKITVLSNGMVVTRGWWGLGKEEVYWATPKATFEYLQRILGTDRAISIGVVVAGSLLAADAYDRHVQRQEPPANQPKPPGWNDQWEWRPNNDGNYRWHDPNGGEWRRHEQDKHHPTPHWDYNPWNQWNSPWENRDDQGNPMPKPGKP